jgi:hypothetical protein
VIRTLENTLKRFSFNNLQISLDRERTQSYLALSCFYSYRSDVRCLSLSFVIGVAGARFLFRLGIIHFGVIVK